MSWKSFMHCLIGALADAGMADDWGWVDPRLTDVPPATVRDADDATIRAMFDNIVGHLDG
jgi:hypothetical protein